MNPSANSPNWFINSTKMNFKETTLDINQILRPSRLPTPITITQNITKFGIQTAIGITDDSKAIPLKQHTQRVPIILPYMEIIFIPNFKFYKTPSKTRPGALEAFSNTKNGPEECLHSKNSFLSVDKFQSKQPKKEFAYANKFQMCLKIEDLFQTSKFFNLRPPSFFGKRTSLQATLAFTESLSFPFHKNRLNF
jgi:hypothetical protein